MPQEKKAKNIPADKIEESPQCYIHDEVLDVSVDSIRKNVCINVEPLTEFEGKHYCLFHLPTKEKDIDKFEEKFRVRLKKVEEKIAEIEKLSKPEQAEAKNKLAYNFHYVWFPSTVNFRNYKFSCAAYFTSATFSAKADFSSAKFSAYTDFSSAKFSAYANFKSVIFSNRTYFSGAIFSDRVNFNSAKFSAYAEFNSAKFSDRADFSGAIFSARVHFGLAKFTETSQIFFQQTKICGTIHFNYAVFAGYIAFEGKRGESVFLKEKGESREALLNLQNARLENTERISFHRVRLCPSWFVNTDSRRMIFTDIDWDNLDAKRDNSNIAAELENLEKREISEPSRLLEIACRQLAANAEENNRYEEAANFRYMAMETKRLEYSWQGRFWTINWWYKFSSGYGENWKRAALVLLGVLLFFGLLNQSPLSTFDYGGKPEQTIAAPGEAGKKNDGTTEKGERFHSMNFGEGLVHSLYVAALQRPEPKAADTLTKAFIILETIFAPLQAALLALAIRRKFMR